MNKKSDVSKWQPAVTLSEAQLRSRKAVRKVAANLARIGARNLTLYAGKWAKLGDKGRVILRDRNNSEPLANHSTPNELLRWWTQQNAQHWNKPIVIKAEVPLALTNVTACNDLEWLKRSRSVEEWALHFGKQWPHVKKLATILSRMDTDSSKHLDKDLRALVEHHPEVIDIAKKFGLPATVPDTGATRAPEAGKQPKQLTDREKRILEVIQCRLKGLAYCRELDNAGIAPPRRGVWRDCPRSYTSAYQEGELWRHRIQDEKSKIRRRAQLAKTR